MVTSMQILWLSVSHAVMHDIVLLSHTYVFADMPNSGCVLARLRDLSSLTHSCRLMSGRACFPHQHWPELLQDPRVHWQEGPQRYHIIWPHEEMRPSTDVWPIMVVLLLCACRLHFQLRGISSVSSPLLLSRPAHCSC